MSRLSTSMQPAHREMYDAAIELVKTTAEPTKLQALRTEYIDKQGRGEYKAYDGELVLGPLEFAEVRGRSKMYFRHVKQKFLAQEAKRSFLYTITSDTAEVVREGEQEELEEETASRRKRVKSVKGEIEEMRTETLALGKQNGEDYARIVKDSAEVGTLYRQINEMELELARLKSTHPPEKRMTTAQAYAKLGEQGGEMESLTEAIDAAEGETERLRESVAREGKAVLRLEREREREEARAGEVRRQREAGGAGVRAHDLGRWYGASLATYRALLGIKAARAVSENELAIEYQGVPGPLTLRFEDGRLVDASIEGVEGMEEMTARAVETGDVPRLVRDVLAQLRPVDK